METYLIGSDVERRSEREEGWLKPSDCDWDLNLRLVKLRRFSPVNRQWSILTLILNMPAKLKN